MKIYRKSAFDKWKFEDKSIQCIITSIPYYSLRKYNIPDIIIGGDESCEHKFEIITHPIQGGHNKVDNMPIEYQYQYCIKCNLAHLVPTLESPKCEHVWEIEKQSQIQRRNPGATGVLADIGTETTYICKKCTTRKYVRLELNEDPLVQFI